MNSRAEEGYPVYDEQSKKLYFARAVHRRNVGGRFAGFDIWYSVQRKPGYWTRAMNLKQLNTPYHNAIVGLGDDGVFLLNNYDQESGTNRSGLSYAVYEDKGFGKPMEQDVRALSNLAYNKYYNMAVNREANVIIVSLNGPGAIGKEDLYAAFKFTGKNKYYTPEKQENNTYWSKLIHLGDTVNSFGFEMSPFLTKDGRYLFFASDRQGGLGSADIYYSERLDDSWRKWSEPVNLGPTINSSGFDAYFFVSDSSRVFFSSNRNTGFADIYQSKMVLNHADTVSVKALKAAAIGYKTVLSFVGQEEKLSIGHYLPTSELLEKYRANSALTVELTCGTSDLSKARQHYLTQYLIEQGIPKEQVVKLYSSSLDEALVEVVLTDGL